MQKESSNESKENIRVIIRIRPRIDREQNQQCSYLQIDGNTIYATTPKNELKQFTYDYVATELSSQSDLFENSARSICDSVLEGYNGTIFAYGQTGSGKTYTLLGPHYSSHQSANTSIEDINTSDIFKDESLGLLPRVICYLFELKGIRANVSNANNNNTSSANYSFYCSFLEIYQEQISDLLDANSNKTITIRDLSNTIIIDGISKLKISSAEEALSLVTKGTKLRHIAPTGMNKESSRSHAVFSIYVENLIKTPNDKKVKTKKSVFHIIDLAGSERQKMTEAVGERIKEAGIINKSLMQLGFVIKNLTEGDNKHIHYRDSKLTHLLKDSLGGNAKTTIIANISPANGNISETISTLMFAQRAKMIKNKAVINEELSNNDTTIFKEEIKKLKDKYNLIKEENFRLLNEIERSKNMRNNDKYVKTIDSVEDEIEGMMADICEKEDELKQVRKENDYLKDKIQKFELDLKIKEKELKDYKSLSQDLRIASDTANNELKDYVLQNAYMSQKVEQSENMYKKKEAMLIQEIEVLTQSINENKKMLDVKEGIISNLNNDIKNYLSIINQKDQKISQMKSEIEEKEKNISDITNEKNTKNETMDALNGEISKLKLEIETKNTTIKNNEYKIDEFKQKGLNLVNKYDQEIKKMKDIITNKTEQYSALVRKYNTLSTILNEAKQAKDNVDNMLTCSHEQIKTYLATINALTDDKQQLKEQNEKLINENAKLSEDLEIYNYNFANNKNQNSKTILISKAKQENAKLKDELIEVKRNLENLTKCYKSGNQRNGNIIELANLLSNKENDLNEARRIMHESINRIKNILNSGNDFDMVNRSQNYLEGKTLEEKFAFFFDKIVAYIEGIEKRETMLKEEGLLKEQKIISLNKEISLMSKFADFKFDDLPSGVNMTNYKQRRQSGIIHSVIKADLNKSTFKTKGKRKYDDFIEEKNEDEKRKFETRPSSPHINDSHNKENKTDFFHFNNNNNQSNNL